MMKKVNREVAEQEFGKWLEFKNIRDKKREDNEQFGETIIEAIADGLLTIDKESQLRFKLPEPLKSDGGDVVCEELVFKPRMRVKELNIKLKNVKADDADGRILAYVAALTDQNSGLISRLFTDDYTLCQAIVMYFL